MTKKQILRQNAISILGGLFLGVIVAIIGLRLLLKNGDVSGIGLIALSNFIAIGGVCCVKDENKGIDD